VLPAAAAEQPHQQTVLPAAAAEQPHQQTVLPAAMAEPTRNPAVATQDTHTQLGTEWKCENTHSCKGCMPEENMRLATVTGGGNNKQRGLQATHAPHPSQSFNQPDTLVSLHRWQHCTGASTNKYLAKHNTLNHQHKHAGTPIRINICRISSSKTTQPQDTLNTHKYKAAC
jgi:hypothetical protein